MKNLSKMLMAVAVFCFFSIACSKKTQQAVIANPASQESQAAPKPKRKRPRVKN